MIYLSLAEKLRLRVKEVIKTSSVLLESLLENVLALKHKRVMYHLQNMLTTQLGPMMIYLLLLQIKVCRQTVRDTS